MKSLRFQPLGSTVTTYLQYTDELHLFKQIDILVEIGNLLTADRTTVWTLLKLGYDHMVINHQTILEITEVADSE